MINTFLDQPLLIQVIMLYIVVWGLFDGVRSTVLRVLVLFTGETFIQNSLGRFLGVVWYVCITTLILYFFDI